MKHYIVKAYIEKSGRCRFEDWYNKLQDKVAKATIQRRVTRLEAGNFGDSKNLGGLLFELKINFGPGFRIYYTVHNAEVVILFVGGDKSTQKKDILISRSLLEQLKNEI